MHETQVGTLRIRYALELRPRRRHPALRHDGGTSFTLLLPPGFPEGGEEAFVRSCARWIVRQVARTPDVRPAPTFAAGETFRLLGRPYVLEVVRAPGRCGPARIDADRLVVALPRGLRGDPLQGVRRRVEGFYAGMAEAVIRESIDHWAPRTGHVPQGFSVRGYRAAWGYCRRDRTLSFNWRLVQAPQEVVDYVVVHELVHLRHMNHSREFWAGVQAHLPEFRQQRRWLRDNGQSLLW